MSIVKVSFYCIKVLYTPVFLREIQNNFVEMFFIILTKLQYYSMYCRYRNVSNKISRPFFGNMKSETEQIWSKTFQKQLEKEYKSM